MGYEKLIEGKILCVIQSHSGALLPTSPVFLRAVNRKPEATESEVVFTFPLCTAQIRAAQVSAEYLRQNKGSCFLGNGSRVTFSYLFLGVPIVQNYRSQVQASWCADEVITLPLPKHMLLRTWERTVLSTCKKSSMPESSVKESIQLGAELHSEGHRRARAVENLRFCLGSQRKRTVSLWSKANLIREHITAYP